MDAESWSSTTLGQLCAKQAAALQTGPFGSQLHAHDYASTGVPVIPTEAIGRRLIDHTNLPHVPPEIAKRLARHAVHVGDILFARRGLQATGLSAMVPKNLEGALCGTGAILLRLLDDTIDPVYLSYYLSSSEVFLWLRAHAVGAVMPNLNTDVLERLPVEYPPLAVQHAIAHILGTLDDKIALNRRMNETLEALARAIFKSWFVDFDPVLAKAEGRNPEGMNAETAALFPDGFEDSALGEIPRGWRVGKLADELDIIGGGTPKTAEEAYWGGDIPWFSVVDAPRDADVWVIDTEKHITKAGVENSSTRVLPKLTTVISARGTVGKCALVGNPMTMNQSCYGLVPTGQNGHRHLYFKVRTLTNELQQGAHGSVFDTITRDSFNAVDTVIPRSEIVNRFDMVVAPLLDRVLINLHESRTLAAIRDALLPKLLSGQIRTC